MDGFNLYYGLKHALRQADELHVKQGGDPSQTLGRGLYWLDMHAMIQSQVRAAEACVAIRYFTAMRRVPGLLKISQSERADIVASNDRQSVYVAALRTLPLTTVILGYYSEKNPAKCWICANKRPVWEEKGTDVNIATEMLCDAYEDKYDLAIVVSADSDLVAPVEAVKKLGKRVRLILPPGRKRAEKLRGAASESRELKIKTIRSMRLPPVIQRAGLPDLKCPAEWCENLGWVWADTPKRKGWRHWLIRKLVAGC